MLKCERISAYASTVTMTQHRGGDDYKYFMDLRMINAFFFASVAASHCFRLHSDCEYRLPSSALDAFPPSP